MPIIVGTAFQRLLLIKNIEELWNNTKRYPSVFKSNDKHIRLSIKEHEDILKSLINRDNLKAEHSMIKHKIRAGKELLSVTQQSFYEKIYKNNKVGG